MTPAERARALIAAFHAGRIDRRRLARELDALYAQELAQEPGAPPVPDGAAMGRADATPGAVDPAGLGLPRPTASGLWILLMADACHFCGRRGLPVLALRAGEEGDWVHLCLDDLERIRGEARAVLEEPTGSGQGGAPAGA